MKTAILQVADTGPLESLVVMLRAAGYDCYLPNEQLRGQLRGWGLDTVLDINNLVRGWGYEQPFELPFAGPEMLNRCDLYVDIKAHRNGPLLWKHVPRLKDRTLWYRINGGKPEHVRKNCICVAAINEHTLDVCRAADLKPCDPSDLPHCEGCFCVVKCEDHGDEVNPPCPVLTPNQWYAQIPDSSLRDATDIAEQIERKILYATRAYACWPPFVRFGDYADKWPRSVYTSPVCLIHNLTGWGYGRIVDGIRALGVRCWGNGSPDGLVKHDEIPCHLSGALAMVHLKSSDAPGYALYEALAAKCPIICTRRLIWRCRMQELLIPGETCLVFDRETHDGLNDADVADCLREVSGHLAALRDPALNRRIGEAGYERLKQVMWREDRDGPTLVEFMQRNFP